MERLQGSEELSKVLKQLPLERCEFKTDSVTHIKGWHAPRGFAFRVSGRFVIEQHQSSGCFDTFVPTVSSDFSSEVIDNEDYLSAVGGILPSEFIGKWLCVDIPSNGIRLCVREDIDPYYDDGEDWLIEIGGHYFNAEGVAGVGEVEWRQRYADPELGSSKIEFIEIEEKEPELYDPRKKVRNDQVRLKSFSGSSYSDSSTR